MLALTSNIHDTTAMTNIPPVRGAETQSGYTPEIYSNALPEPRDRASFSLLQFGANVLSLYRIPASIALARRMNNPDTDYRSDANASRMALIGASDWLDGVLAKKINVDNNRTTRKFGKFIDPFTDKFSTDVVLSTIAIQELNDGNRLYGGFVAACAGIIATRDVITTIARVNAISDDEKDVAAKRSGKVKAAAMFITTTTMLSPLARSTTGRAACCAGLALSTGMSVTSGIELVRSFQDIPQPNSNEQQDV